MRLAWGVVVLALGAAVDTLGQPAAATRSDRVWIAPAPASADMLRLFAAEHEWTRARALTRVFKFYQQHTITPAHPIVGPNTYEALARAGAFRTVSERWQKKLALEVGAVKEFYCTPDDTGMRSAVDATLASIAAVQRAGGSVDYLAMDEPFVAGALPVCGGGALEPTAERVAFYTHAVRHAHPSIRIGLIEAYPFSGAERFAGMLFLLRARGALPEFLHLDVHLPAIRGGRHVLSRDLKRIAFYCQRHGVPFGVIIWGENGDTDALYATGAMTLTDAFAESFGSWQQIPDHLVFQSWAESTTGLRMTPTNLPESKRDTLTELLSRGLRRLGMPTL
jgi:hypothetical protein